jgi:hypothetical protein
MLSFFTIQLWLFKQPSKILLSVYTAVKSILYSFLILVAPLIVVGLNRSPFAVMALAL